MFTVCLSKQCPCLSFNSMATGPLLPQLRTLFLWFITPSLLLSLLPHTPPRYFRLPLGLQITPPTLCMTCHVMCSLSTLSLMPDPRIHHPSHPRQVAIVLHTQQDLHPPLGTLRRSPNLSGGCISHAGCATTSGHAHALHSIHRLSCTLRHDSYDSCTLYKSLALWSAHFTQMLAFFRIFLQMRLLPCLNSRHWTLWTSHALLRTAHGP